MHAARAILSLRNAGSCNAITPRGPGDGQLVSISHAFLDTVLGSFPLVLAALGNHFDEVPIQDAVDAFPCALRANALEKLGHVDAAAAELLD